MSLPKKLQEARENGTREHNRCGYSYSEGFDSCFELLAPEIEKLVEVIEQFKECACDRQDIMSNAIKQWREFTGEK